MSEYAIVKTSSDMYIGRVIKETDYEIILNQPLKIHMIRESLDTISKCYVSEWNELSEEKSVVLNKLHVLYVTSPTKHTIEYYIDSLKYFEEKPLRVKENHEELLNQVTKTFH